MGNCISKNCTNITLAISEKDLANATIALSKISTENLHRMVEVNSIDSEKVKFVQLKQNNLKQNLKKEGGNGEYEQDGQRQTQRQSGGQEQKQEQEPDQKRDLGREQKVQQSQQQQQHLLPKNHAITSKRTTINDSIDFVISNDCWQNCKQVSSKQTINTTLNANTCKQILKMPKTPTDFMMTTETTVTTNNCTHNNNNITYYNNEIVNDNYKRNNTIDDNDDDYKNHLAGFGDSAQASNQSDAIMESLLYVEKQNYNNSKNYSNKSNNDVPSAISLSSTSEMYISSRNLTSQSNRLSNFNNNVNNNNYNIFHNYYTDVPHYLMEITFISWP